MDAVPNFVGLYPYSHRSMVNSIGTKNPNSWIICFIVR